MNTPTIKVSVLAATSLAIATVAMAHPLPTAPTEPFNPDKFWTDRARSGN